ncbi:MAG: helix-turn-helix domain-containing protein [Methylophaga sp.]|uniref:helix-turn-helix domain-containing protein n=1 Tax=Methylophaga sp. TaxID=2024840 RepID=UPI00299DEA8E|nr:helix-turn-helix domain-containing protein [Methylophaga sp.]MDX1749070.1 helix-turn-helix domain-containing protein [Methylophaga sp.]
MSHYDLPETICVNEVANLLNCSPKTVLDKAGKGELPGAKIGKSWTFKKSDVEAYLNKEIERQTLARKNRYAPQQKSKDVQPRSYQEPVARKSPYPDLSPYRRFLKP